MGWGWFASEAILGKGLSNKMHFDPFGCSLGNVGSWQEPATRHTAQIRREIGLTSSGDRGRVEIFALPLADH
jgi:hypothetical protein